MIMRDVSILNMITYIYFTFIPLLLLYLLTGFNVLTKIINP